MARRLILLVLLVMAWPRAAAAGVEALAADYPVYLFTKNIMAGVPDSRVTLLTTVPGGRHVLAPMELETLSRADILISGGLSLDIFLERALGVAKPSLKIIDAGARAGDPLILDLAAARKWYLSQDPPRAAPHLFASLSGAAVMTGNLAEALARLDPQAAEIYRVNAAGIISEYQRLLYECQAVADRWSPRPRVILSHGVLIHLAADLRLNVAGIIEAPEAEPSARLAELVGPAQDSAAILADPYGRLDLARTLGAKARRPVALIDPVASGPAEPPPDYFQKVFRTNLTVLNELFAGKP